MLLPRQSKNPAQEVGSTSVVDPRGAEDDMSAAALRDGLLPRKLAAAVYVKRPSCVVFGVRLRLSAVEDIVGGVMNHQAADSPHLQRHTRGRDGIHRVRKFR